VKLEFLKNKQVKNAIIMGTLCSLSYLGVYIARNILGAVTPQMIGDNALTMEYIGEVSSLYFIFYAVGQLINGIVGDKIKARYMISLGLLLAGVCNLVFPDVIDQAFMAKTVYSMSGFFLSMIYAPMTKMVAENTNTLYAMRCSVGYNFASLLGSPVAGIMSTFLAWEQVFKASGMIVLVMGIICMVAFGYMEKVGIIQYNQFVRPKKEKQKNSIIILLKREIVKYTFISIVTGVIRTTVIFWLPTYLTQYLEFTDRQSASIFSAVTLVTSTSTFIAVLFYEKVMKRKLDLTILVSFVLATVGFLGVYFVSKPIFNIILLIMGIIGSGMAASMLFSWYCPSLRDTGLVSSATGFIDFVSYMSAAIASTLFANAVDVIGWKNLILTWIGLMVMGIIVSLPYKKLRKANK